MQENRVKASVIVPSRNRADVLPDLLDSLDAQTLDPCRFEVIVVDNGSTDGTKELVQARAQQTRYRLTFQPLPTNRGPVFSRNAASALAVGEVLAFTDSDCRVAPNWLEIGLDCLSRNPEAAFVSGIVLDKPEQPVRALSLTHAKTDLEDPTYRACNIFYRRCVFQSVGGFDQSTYLGENDIWHYEFGDIELAWRLKRLGYASCFEPRLTVYHEVWNVALLSWLTKHTQQGVLPLFLNRYPEAAPLFIWRTPFLAPSNALWYVTILGLVLGSLIHPAYFILALAYFSPDLGRQTGRLLFRRPTRAFAILLLQFLGQSVACAALLVGSFKARRLVL